MNRGGVARWIPALGWLRTYDFVCFRGDFVAGITLAAYLLPAGLGDASLANLPPEAGLYACLFGALTFWLGSGSDAAAIERPCRAIGSTSDVWSRRIDGTIAGLRGA